MGPLDAQVYETTRGIEQVPALVEYTTLTRPSRTAIERPSQGEGLSRSNDYSNLGSTGRQFQGKLEVASRTNRMLSIPDSEKPTTAFAEFTARKHLSEMSAYLHELGRNLDKPDGAALMVGFRESLAAVWKVKDALANEKVLVISAIEEAIRGKKWREFTLGQIDALQEILEKSKDTSFSEKTLTTSIRLIHKHHIDIYPSSLLDENDLEGE